MKDAFYIGFRTGVIKSMFNKGHILYWFKN